MLGGLELSDFKNNVISNNSITDNGGSGIKMTGNSSSNNISGNRINGNDIGICLNYSLYYWFYNETAHTDPNVNNSITGNDILNNSIYGIYSAESVSTIEGNTIDFNGVGIYLNGSNSSEVNGNDVCSNSVADFSLYLSHGNYGDGNTCSASGSWNDDGASGCSYKCSTTTTTSTTNPSTSTSTTVMPCSLQGDYPPCGTVTLPEVIAQINQWSSGEASLESVINLIDAWASG